MSLFDGIADALEQATDMSRLEARGTLRLALKKAGLEAASISGDQMNVVLRKVMPQELKSRGIETADSICETLATKAKGMAGEAGAGGDSPEDVFRRLGGD